MKKAPPLQNFPHSVTLPPPSPDTNHKIQEVFSSAQKPVIELVREFHDRSALIIPTYENPERRETIQQVLMGIKDQQEKVNTYIADNGISPETRAVIEEFAKKTGIAIKGIIDARPTSNDQRNPSFARNRAVNDILRQGYDHPDARVDSFIFGDDDAVFSPNALRLLTETHHSAMDIAAVVPEIVPVRALGQHLFQASLDAKKNNNSQTTMPNLWTEDGQIELLKIIGFSSDVTTKSCGLLIDAEAIRRIRNKGKQDLFIKMPRNSGEDMLVGAALSRLGRVIRNNDAKIFDKVRSSALDTRKQRAAWGEDHVYIAHDLHQLGYTQTGLTVLQANHTNGEWSEFNMQNFDQTTFIINPEQLAQVLETVKQIYQQEGPEDFFRNFGVSVDQARFEKAIETLEKLLSDISGEKIARRTLVKRKYQDVAPMNLEPLNNPRFSIDALCGLLVGNLVGNANLNPARPIFYGLRQALAKKAA